LGILWRQWATLGFLRRSWATLGWLGHMKKLKIPNPLASVGYIGFPSAFLSYLGLAWTCEKFENTKFQLKSWKININFRKKIIYIKLK
jgi:hypothetical protein